MAEISGIGSGGVLPQSQNQIGGERNAATQVNPANLPDPNAPVGQPGPLGQPTGVPIPPGQQPVVLPEVLTGSHPTQMIAAEQMRARGGASAVEELLGLNKQPTIMGALAAPPGNSEALRHITPTMRRAIMRNLLDKQRERMRRVVALMQQERQRERNGEEEASDRAREELLLAKLEEAQKTRAHAELSKVAQMLELLDELLAMQDYAISQMGTFAHG